MESILTEDDGTAADHDVRRSRHDDDALIGSMS
jgi:hypothetical protein